MKKLLMVLILVFPVCTLSLWVYVGLHKHSAQQTHAGPSGTNSMKIESIAPSPSPSPGHP